MGMSNAHPSSGFQQRAKRNAKGGTFRCCRPITVPLQPKTSKPAIRREPSKPNEKRGRGGSVNPTPLKHMRHVKSSGSKQAVPNAKLTTQSFYWMTYSSDTSETAWAPMIACCFLLVLHKLLSVRVPAPAPAPAPATPFSAAASALSQALALPLCLLAYSLPLPLPLSLPLPLPYMCIGTSSGLNF